MVMLTSPSALGGVALMELAIGMEGQMPEGCAFGSGTSAVDCGMPTFRQVCPQAALHLWPVTWTEKLPWGLCTYSVLWGRQPANLSAGVGRLLAN